MSPRRISTRISPVTKGRTYSEQLEAARYEIIRRALERYKGNKTHAAWELKIDRNYMQRLVKKYGLQEYC